VRLLVDAHISVRGIVVPLRAQGHDVRAAAEDRTLDASPDEKLLSLASAEHRILVTFNVRDFARLGVAWTAAGRSHGGCVLLVGLQHHEFGLVLRQLEAVFRARPDQQDWRDYLAFVGRSGRY